MNRILKTVLAAVLLGVVAGPVAAQQATPRPTGLLSAVFISRLNLTDEQAGKVKAAGEAYTTAFTQAQALTEDQAKKAASRKARKDYDAALNATLTADQQKQLGDLRTEGKELTGMMGNAGNQLAGMGLTADQKAKVKEIGAKYAPEREKLAAQLKEATDKKPVQDQVNALNRKMMGEIRTILTPEQIKLLPGRQPKK